MATQNGKLAALRKREAEIKARNSSFPTPPK
jgi:hypothetical protein